MKFYKSDKGYFYKIKNNGDKVRISQDTFNKNIKVGGVNTNATQSPLVTVNRDPLTKNKSVLYYLGIALGKKYIVVTRQDIKNRDNNENRSAAKFSFNTESNLIMIIYQKNISNGICIYQDSNNIIIKPYNVMKKQIKTFPLVQDINLSNTLYNINRRMSNSIINDISDEVKQLFKEINESSALMIMPN